jgi:hypothetical protein
MRVEAGGVDADLVHVGLADDQRALRAQPRHDGGVGDRRLAQEPSARGGGVAGDIQLLLHRDGHAVKRADWRTGLPARRGRPCLGDHIVTSPGHDGARLCCVGL